MTDRATAFGGRVDVAVIGSGFGGAAVACRLAQAGKTVAVLEQGKRYPTGRGDIDVTGHGESTVRRGHFWVDIGYGMDVIRGIGVGGGSLHYFGVRLRASPVVFENPRWPAAITRTTLEPYYDIADEMLRSEPVAPHPVLGMPRHGEAFMAAAKACRRCNGEPYLVPIAVNTRPEPIETPEGTPQTRCVFCGECLIGCPPSQSFAGNVNARALLTLNYLAVAENTKKATIFPLHRVRYITPVKDGFDLEIVTLDNTESEETERVVNLGFLHAKQVVLAAGTMGTVELLLRSKGRLSGLSDKVGHYFSGNGDFLVPRTVGTPQNLQPTAGPTITAGADFSTKENLITIEDLGMIPFLQAVMGTTETALSTTDPYQLGYLGMGTDAGNGILKLQDGRIRLYWDPTESMLLYQQITEALREMSQQLGGTYQKPTLYQPTTGAGLITAHPLGGAVMSDRVEDGVVNDRGEVHNVPNLFVADGSIIPTAIATNPSFTISALAERVAFWMINGREITDKDPRPRPS